MKNKTVNAYAEIDTKGNIISLSIDEDSWLGTYGRIVGKIVPCKVTYEMPEKKKDNQ